MKLNEPERKNITIKVKFLSVDEARIISQNNSRLNRDTDSPVHTTLKKQLVSPSTVFQSRQYDGISKTHTQVTKGTLLGTRTGCSVVTKRT